MSERLPHHGERHTPHHEGAPRPEHHKPTKEQLEASQKQQKELANEMQQLSEALAQSSEDLNIQKHGEDKAQTQSFGMYKELRLENYRRILKRVQSRLKGPEKSFSKVVHNKRIDAVSSAGARTVARPVGILAGGLAAFIGSLVVLLTARRYGFTYNFSLFIFLFIGGYLFGTILEVLAKTIKRSR